MPLTQFRNSSEKWRDRLIPEGLRTAHRGVRIGALMIANPSAGTACNFVLTLPFTGILSVVTLSSARLDGAGSAYAMVSGALVSGIGYCIWYVVLPSLSATVAATLQLSVPVIAAVGGVLFLGEDFTLRLALCSISILGGIGLVIAGKRVVCAP